MCNIKYFQLSINFLIYIWHNSLLANWNCLLIFTSLSLQFTPESFGYLTLSETFIMLAQIYPTSDTVFSCNKKNKSCKNWCNSVGICRVSSVKQRFANRSGHVSMLNSFNDPLMEPDSWKPPWPSFMLTTLATLFPMASPSSSNKPPPPVPPADAAPHVLTKTALTVFQLCTYFPGCWQTVPGVFSLITPRDPVIITTINYNRLMVAILKLSSDTRH